MITTDPKKLKQNRNKNKATLQNIPPGNGTDPGPAQGIVSVQLNNSNVTYKLK